MIYLVVALIITLIVCSLSISLNILFFSYFATFVANVQTQLKTLEKAVFPNYPWNDALERDNWDTIPGRIRKIWIELGRK